MLDGHMATQFQHWWRPTAALDATRIGGQDYSPAEMRQAMEEMRHTDYTNPRNTAGMALSSGVPGRTFRQILSDLDGRVMLLGKRGSGLFVCHWADEAEAYTSYLEKHWRSERERCRIRRHFAGGLPRRQGQLFDDAPLLWDDGDDDDD